MHLFETLGIAVGLGADAMSVSAAIGVRWHGGRQRFRLAWHMGLFQFLMPLAGWSLGSSVAGLVQSFGSYLAGALVCLIGAKMLYEALHSHPGAVAETVEHLAEPESSRDKDPTRGWSLMALAVATSLDALVVGFSLGLRPDSTDHPIFITSLIVGLTAAAMSFAGVALGKRVGKALGRPAEIIGALILIALGVSFMLL